jgi:hypothetical protein
LGNPSNSYYTVCQILIKSPGYTFIDNFLTPQQASRLRAELFLAKSKGRFEQAALVRKKNAKARAGLSKGRW